MLILFRDFIDSNSISSINFILIVQYKDINLVSMTDDAASVISFVHFSRST